MKCSRMLFLPKNYSLLVNMLPSTEHSVKNKENVKLPSHFLKYGRAYFHICILCDSEGLNIS